MVNNNYNSTYPPVHAVLNLTDVENYDRLARTQNVRLRLGGELDVASRISAIRRESFTRRMITSLKTVRFTIVTHDGDIKNCDLNIKSVAEKLNISQRKVRSLARDPDGLNKLNRIALLKIKTANTCREIIENCETIHGNLMQNGVQLRIRSDRLNKIIRKAVDLTLEPPGETTLKTFKLYGQRFFVGRTPDEPPRFFSSQLIGHGSYGKVYKITCLNTASTFALKKAKKKLNGVQSDKPLQKLKEEIKVLQKINPTGKLEGIQSPPYSDILGNMYIAPLYAGGFISFRSSFEKLPMVQKLELCRQLLSGLYTLHRMGYVHGDIKPANCLVELEAGTQNPTKMVIGDFGGAQKLKPIMNNYSYTEPYVPPDEGAQIRTGWYHKGAVIQSCDVYAMSKTLIEMLLGGQESRRGVQSILVDATNYTDLRDILMESGVPFLVADVLLRGMFPFSERPNSHELYDDFRYVLHTAGLEYHPDSKPPTEHS